MSEHSPLATVLIHAPPARVCSAFVNADEMSRYWFTRRDHVLKQGETARWYLGGAADAAFFEVHVRELQFPHKLVIEWPGDDGKLTTVTWLFEETEGGETVLTIRETGFSGNDAQTFNRILDSTGGFNQVIIAAKAYIEHGAELNVVADHA